MPFGDADIEVSNEKKEEKAIDDFKLSFNIVSYEPKDLKNAVKAYDPKTHEVHSLDDKKIKKDSKGVYKTKAGNPCELVYMMRFLCKDPSTAHNSFMYSILLYSKDKIGAEFFNDEPKNLHLKENKAALENLQKKMELLTKFNVYVEGMTKMTTGWLVLLDTTVMVDS